MGYFILATLYNSDALVTSALVTAANLSAVTYDDDQYPLAVDVFFSSSLSLFATMCT
jgi:hypothetical protein